MLAAMLEEFYHEGIPVGEGGLSAKPVTALAQQLQPVDWGQRCESRNLHASPST